MDYGGMSCQINEIQEITHDNNLKLIEDAAEGLGSSINQKKVGSIADASIFSFCGNKVITTGEGGAIVTNSKETYEKLKLIRSHGRQDKTNYFDDPSGPDYVGLGYNWRMSSITASLGIAQISKLDKIIQMRKDNAQYISRELSKIPEIQVPNTPKGHDHIYQMYTIQLSNRKIREDLHNYLTDKKIFSKVYFQPIHLSKYYLQNSSENQNLLPITEKISQRILTLPLYPNMLSEEKEYLISTIKEFFENR
jgi:perosamine synthetase